VVLFSLCACVCVVVGGVVLCRCVCDLLIVVQSAVASGVSAECIVAYLERNAHPLMALQSPILPETVVNQIHLWAKERDRISAQRCKLYDNFDSFGDFDQAVTYAGEMGVLLWSKRNSDARQVRRCVLAVAADGHAAMKSFLAAARR